MAPCVQSRGTCRVLLSAYPALLHKAGDLGASLCLGSAQELLTGMLKCDSRAVPDAAASGSSRFFGIRRWSPAGFGSSAHAGQGKSSDFSRSNVDFIISTAKFHPPAECLLHPKSLLLSWARFGNLCRDLGLMPRG